MPRPTVKIVDPGKAGDYQVINLEDWDPETMTRWTPDVGVPRPATPVDASAAETAPDVETPTAPLTPREIVITVEVDRMAGMTVAEQGPVVATYEDQEILERLRMIEKRKSALAIIDARLRAIRARLFR